MRGYEVVPDRWAVVGGKWKGKNNLWILEERNNKSWWTCMNNTQEEALVNTMPALIVEIPPGVTNFYTYDNPQVGGYPQTIGCEECGARGSEYHHKNCKWFMIENAQSNAEQLLQPYKCKTCNNPNLDSRDLETNPATGNIWGCHRCGSKQLEAI